VSAGAGSRAAFRALASALASALAAAAVPAAAPAARLPAQASVAVSAPATLAPGEPALVRVEVTAPARADVRLAAPAVAPFTVASAARVPAADPASLRGWRRHEWRYVLAPAPGARGRYAFAPFAAEIAGPGLRPTTARSRPWGLVVRAPAPPPPPVAGASAGAGATGGAPQPARRGGVQFSARVYPDTVYVGQQATYELTVSVDADTRARIRRNPEFVPPELRGVIAVDLPSSHQAGADGDVHVYRRALFALAPGAVPVPSARLSYALALGTSYFSPEERLALRTAPVRFTAVAPPGAGRPRGWDGAVGVLRAAARTAAPGGRAGDPVEYTVRVEGSGNVGLLPRPALAVAWADVVEAGDRVEVDSTAPTVGGAKEFTWLITPRTAGAYATPALRYPYFDPVRRVYDELAVPAVPVDVRPGAGPAVAAADAPARAARGDRLGIRTAWRGAFAPPLPSRPAFWLLLALAPAPAAAVLLVQAAGRRRRARPVDAARALRRLAQGDPVEPRTLRRVVNAAFAGRLGFDAGILDGAAAFARALRRVGVTEATAARAAELVAALDAAAFDAAATGGTATERGVADLAARAHDVFATVDREARPRTAIAVPPAAGRRAARDSAVRGWLVAAAASATAAALGACALSPAAGAAADAAAAAFARGTAAYARGDVRAARAAFLDAAGRAPAAPDAWANAGTAAWAAADTLGAAVAWQRALRLEPTARDMRERLALLPAAQDGWIAGVPPVDPDWLAAAALAAAAVAGALALRGAVARRPRPAAGWVWGWGAALGVAGAGGALAAHVAPAGLAVVVTAGPLRTEPALAAEPGQPADPTDVARVTARQGTWSRVALDGRRDGWIESARLAPLDAAAAAAGAGPPGLGR
jgi:tetratricopeptide (TPR) repeat protein